MRICKINFDFQLEATLKRQLSVLLTAVILVGCSSGNQEHLSSWMQGERASIRPNVSSIEAPKDFTPLPYLISDGAEPYSEERLASILRGNKDKVIGNSALIEAEESRRKQPLESFPLDSIVMVGSLNKQGAVVALVKVNELLHQISKGNYLGQNYGQVMAVTEGEILIREIFQDPLGEWVERPTSLQLQEELSK